MQGKTLKCSIIKQNLPVPLLPATKPYKSKDGRAVVETFQEAIIKRTHLRWTKERVAVLEDLHEQGWSSDDIAQELGISVDAVRHRLRRLKKGW